MAITLVENTVTQGFCNSFISADANGGEIIVPLVTGKRIYLKFFSLTNNTAGTLSFSLTSTSDGNVVGPFEINALTTVTMSLPLDIIITVSEDLKITSDAGSVSGVVQGFIK